MYFHLKEKAILENSMKALVLFILHFTEHQIIMRFYPNKYRWHGRRSERLVEGSRGFVKKSSTKVKGIGDQRAYMLGKKVHEVLIFYQPHFLDVSE